MYILGGWLPRACLFQWLYYLRRHHDFQQSVDRLIGSSLSAGCMCWQDIIDSIKTEKALGSASIASFLRCSRQILFTLFYVFNTLHACPLIILQHGV